MGSVTHTIKPLGLLQLEWIPGDDLELPVFKHPDTGSHQAVVYLRSVVHTIRRGGTWGGSHQSDLLAGRGCCGVCPLSDRCTRDDWKQSLRSPRPEVFWYRDYSTSQVIEPRLSWCTPLSGQWTRGDWGQSLRFPRPGVFGYRYYPMFQVIQQAVCWINLNATIKIVY